MSDTIRSVEVYPLQIPRTVPYLGPLGSDSTASGRGYFVRSGNRTIYSVNDHTLLVKLTTQEGAVGWGESFGVISPGTVANIISDLAPPFLIGRDPHDGIAIVEDLYNGMRVRGYTGGFYADAIAGIDIALWDLRGKLTGLPVCKLLGAQRHTRLPAYVSGLPRAERSERADLAAEWMQRGFDALKFAAVIMPPWQEIEEMEQIRAAVGPKPRILVDLHWRYTDQEAVKLISRLEEYDLHVAEAPVESEDIEGQAYVAARVTTPVAIGEEYRTTYEYRPRFIRRCMSIIQPEMAHMGITSFWQVGQMARTFHCRIMPHATIGIGVAQAASLHACAALENFVIHEYQHSVFDRNLQFITGTMRCTDGYFELPQGPGLGVEPTPDVLAHAMS